MARIAASAAIVLASTQLVSAQYYCGGYSYYNSGCYGNGLSSGARIGIGVGIAVGALVLIAVLSMVCRRRRSRKFASATAPVPAGGYHGAPTTGYTQDYNGNSTSATAQPAYGGSAPYQNYGYDASGYNSNGNGNGNGNAPAYQPPSGPPPQTSQYYAPPVGPPPKA
ncbi:uncharacterized protein L969DRAFT_55262 [Mixia osmundae IAM 14324]|uniref:Uncharacterized protein n=1 Tax=Mixia osmundae (strain CBS 9802 / IAM 14324 / JCM 22182 / KY 12970) TaxID=764103 RepID=G7DV35_MIXOS|nr:uncharacterized protein L969DRAFT_55262 [Mixia osmundae IAM 14324]KEI36338.1 hypothetical protein L969DRAFT_55262 [Mixia osmundae IAM 14324]GAA94445.1 hypothetical protein E5Q_01097 [Mixia osmundae IAM 14324]